MVNNKISQEIVDGLPEALDKCVNERDITNCITKAYSDFNLEFNNGTFTLKSGSKVYDGNGLFKTIQSDITLTPSGYTNVPHVIFVKEDGTLWARAIQDCASGTTIPSSGYSLFYNTDDKKVYQIDNGTLIGTASFPLCKFSVANGVATSVDQTFDDFGYIGGTLFGFFVEGWISDARNTDGKLKNIPLKTTAVSVSPTYPSVYSSPKQYLFIYNENVISDNPYYYESDTEPTEWTQRVWFDTKNNLIKYKTETGTINIVAAVMFGTCSVENGRITSLSTKKTFQAIDRNALPDIFDYKLRTVTALPEKTDSDVFYFITE